MTENSPLVGPPRGPDNLRTASAAYGGASSLKNAAGKRILDPSESSIRRILDKMPGHEMPKHWDEEADVVVVGYGFAGSAAAIAAHDEGAKVLLLEKAPERHKGGNSRVCAQVLFWPNDIDKAKTYFRALAGPYMDNISDEMVQVWATEMYVNRTYLEGLGMNPVSAGGAEFPEFAGSDCVQMLLHSDEQAAGNDESANSFDHLLGGERLWIGVTEPALALRKVRRLYETAAVKLLKVDGEVVGLIAEKNGNAINIKAKRAVILTCGGFENNPSMVRTYVEGAPHIYPAGTPYNTGDGIMMGIDVGADLWHMANIAGPELFFKAPDIAVSLDQHPAPEQLHLCGQGRHALHGGRRAVHGWRSSR
jgi:succinate dehydrogenase/fumarate reductase flavoprotein subunit